MEKSVGYEKPLLVELSLLLDTAHGFSEPDPPGGDDAGNNNKEQEDQQESDSFDWL
ncbi:hypothetical protein KQI52_06135 [bacterium]|nr:hypothetical protein [bacterium]